MTADRDVLSVEFGELVRAASLGPGVEDRALSERDRTLLGLVAPAAQAHGADFRQGVRSALDAGCTQDEVRMTLVHLTVHAGLEASVAAFREAREIFAQTHAYAEVR